MSKKVGINEGLEALFGSSPKSLFENDNVEENKNKYCQVDISLLVVNPYQPRTIVEADDDLIASIDRNGIIQPLLVRQISAEHYQIIAGERRYKAARKLKLTTIPVFVKDVDDDVAAAYALIENIQRKQLTAIEEAKAYQRLIKDFQLTHQQVSEKVGRSRSSITNALRLLELDNYVKEHLEAGYLEMGHARALLTITKDEQTQAVNKIIDGKLNVRQTEQLVQRIKNPIVKTVTALPAQDRMLLESWRQRLLPHASQVKVKMDAHDNISVNIKCNSPEEADELINEIEKLKSQRTTKG